MVLRYILLRTVAPRSINPDRKSVISSLSIAGGQSSLSVCFELAPPMGKLHTHTLKHKTISLFKRNKITLVFFS